MNVNLVVLSIPIFFLLIGIELIYDRIKQKKLYRLNDSFANISCGITEQVSGVFAKVFTIAAYDLVFQNFHLFKIPSTWYWWIIAYLGVEFCYYWAHRKSHEVNLFWAGHVVHHQSEEYNLSVALRQSAMQKVFTFYFYLPLAFIGFKTEWFLLISAINLLYQFWIHTQTIDKMGWFELIFNTPSHHRVHHGRDPKYIDKNHGGSLIIWDRLFGTFQVEEEAPTYGITTPLQTFNPVYAQMAYFKNIWSDFKSVSGVKNKMGVLFNKPGWLPLENGGYRAPHDVDKNHYRKFDLRIAGSMNIYLLFQYVICLAGVAAFLFNQEQLDSISRYWGAGLIFYSMASLGLLFDGRSYALTLEFGRIVLTPILLISVLDVYFQSGIYPSLLVVYAIASSLWLAVLSKKYLSFLKVTS